MRRAGPLAIRVVMQPFGDSGDEALCTIAAVRVAWAGLHPVRGRAVPCHQNGRPVPGGSPRRT